MAQELHLVGYRAIECGTEVDVEVAAGIGADLGAGCASGGSVR